MNEFCGWCPDWLAPYVTPTSMLLTLIVLAVAALVMAAQR